MLINYFLLINLESIVGGTVSCNFDQDWCGYKHNFMVRYTGRSHSPSSGPKFDQSTRKNYFYKKLK